jgi:type IV pilus assembly protein PilE
MTLPVQRCRARGFTLAEVLTALVVVVVLVAVAIPSWRSHSLRVRRGEAIALLVAVQSAQDDFFGRHARYADASQLAIAPPEGLGLGPTSERGNYSLQLNAGSDGLGFLATARRVASGAQADDSRCVEFSIDHNGRRRAKDAEGRDRSADCWR